MKISCAITDDEPVARRGIESYVRRVPFLHLAGICEDALQTTTLLQSTEVQLLFLDIEMPQLTGIELIQSLPVPPAVILTTAYDHYALKGFDLNAVDYLLKPIAFERFMIAVNKAALLLNPMTGKPEPDSVFLKVDGRMEKVRFRDIICIQALENYIAIYTQAKKLIVHTPLKSVMEGLPGSFVQPHKSWLVNPDFVTAIEGNYLVCGAHHVPVSKYQKAATLQALLRGRTLKKD